MFTERWELEKAFRLKNQAGLRQSKRRRRRRSRRKWINLRFSILMSKTRRVLLLGWQSHNNQAWLRLALRKCLKKWHLRARNVVHRKLLRLALLSWKTKSEQRWMARKKLQRRNFKKSLHPENSKRKRKRGQMLTQSAKWSLRGRSRDWTSRWLRRICSSASSTQPSRSKTSKLRSTINWMMLCLCWHSRDWPGQAHKTWLEPSTNSVESQKTTGNF